MNLPQAIKTAGLTLAQLGTACGVAGKNPARTVQRYLTGEREAPAEFKQAVTDLVGDAVSVDDFHQARIDWLSVHDPERLVSLSAGTLARQGGAVSEINPPELSHEDDTACTIQSVTR